jgi:hypothetical protein
MDSSSRRQNISSQQRGGGAAAAAAGSDDPSVSTASSERQQNVEEKSFFPLSNQIHPRISLANSVNNYYYTNGPYICGYIAALVSILGIKDDLEKLKSTTFNSLIVENAALHFDKPINKLIEYFFLILRRDRQLFYKDDVQTLLRNCYLSSITYLPSSKTRAIGEKIDFILQNSDEFIAFSRKSLNDDLKFIEWKSQNEQEKENSRFRLIDNPSAEDIAQYEKNLQNIISEFDKNKSDTTEYYQKIERNVVQSIRKREDIYRRKQLTSNSEDLKIYEKVVEAEEYRFYRIYQILEIRNSQRAFQKQLQETWDKEIEDLNNYRFVKTAEIQREIDALQQELIDARRYREEAQNLQEETDKQMVEVRLKQKEARKLMSEAITLENVAKEIKKEAEEQQEKKREAEKLSKLSVKAPVFVPSKK